MAVYMFPFPLSAVGAVVNIEAPSGAVVDTGTLTASMLEGGVVMFRSTLPEGVYNAVGARAPWVGSLVQQGILDVPDSIEEAGGGGGTVEEPARFIGTVTGDTSGTEFALTFAADPNYDPVDWASVDSGDIVLPGPVTVRNMFYRYHATLDFTDAAGFSTATNSPDTDVTIKADRGGDTIINLGGPYYYIPTGTAGTVFDVDAVEAGITEYTRCSGNVELRVTGTVNAFGYASGGAHVDDGILTAAVAIWIYRAPLPDLPALP